MTIWDILKERDKEYRALYAEFLERKKAVRGRMEGEKGNGR
jgi:hypothetical protein